MIKKYSINIAGHQTSVSLEEEFWQMLKKIASSQEISLSNLITKIDENCTLEGKQNLSSAIRIFILKTLEEQVNQG